MSPVLPAGAALRRPAGVGARTVPGPAARRRRRRGGDDHRERPRQPAGVAGRTANSTTACRCTTRERSFPQRFFGARVRGPLTQALGARRRLPYPRRLERAGVVGLASGARRRACRTSSRRAGCCSRRRCGAAACARRRRSRCSTRRNLTGAALLHATSEQEAGALRALDLGVPVAVVPERRRSRRRATARRAATARGSAFPPTPSSCCSSAACTASSGSICLPTRSPRARDASAMHLVLAGPDEHGLIPGSAAPAGRATPALCTRPARSTAPTNGRC